jgi:hypothetical protein
MLRFKQLHDFHFSTNITGVRKSTTVRGKRLVSCMGEICIQSDGWKT